MTDKITIERETLLPCPFCGGEPEADPSYQAGTYYGCHECGVWMMGAAKWNRRAALAQKAEPTEGAIVVSKNEAGQIVCVSRQDEDGRFLSIIAESADAPPAPAAVPPGYVLVPIEPTQAILDAPFVGKVQPQDWHSHKRSRELMAENYRAMNAAAGDKP